VVKKKKIEKVQKFLEEEKKEIKEPIYKTKIKLVAIGGGAGNIISELALSLPRVSFIAANTDFQALNKIKEKVLLFQLGQNLTKGLGTGRDVDLGREAALKEKEKIKKLLSGCDFCILLVCLGGGTGSGAGPVFAKIAKSLGLLTLGIFTLPFKFEGEKKMEIARLALQKLKPHLDAFILLSNEKIFQVINKNTSLQEAFSAINKNLSKNLMSLIEIIYQPGLINIDFADLKTILEGKGKLAFLNTVLIDKGKEKNELIKEVINNPFYSYSIGGAKGILLNIIGEKDLSLFDISQISKTILELSHPEAKIIFGLGQSGRRILGNKIKVTLLATGCLNKIFGVSLENRKKPIKKKSEPEILEKQVKDKKRKRGMRKKVAEKSKKKEILLPKTEEQQKEENVEIKIRKNSLQLKKEIEEAEKEILTKEEIWETPAFLRNKKQ